MAINLPLHIQREFMEILFLFSYPHFSPSWLAFGCPRCDMPKVEFNCLTHREALGKCIKLYTRTEPLGRAIIGCAADYYAWQWRWKEEPDADYWELPRLAVVRAVWRKSLKSNSFEPVTSRTWFFGEHFALSALELICPNLLPKIRVNAKPHVPCSMSSIA